VEFEELNRSLGRVESAVQAIREQTLAHQASDEKLFNEIKDLISKQHDRLSRVEASTDAIEGHGAAIVDFEDRLNKSESLFKIDVAQRARDRMWMKWILYLVAALVGDHFTGSKISEFAGHLIK
jgi:hypothetical protein